VRGNAELESDLLEQQRLRDRASAQLAKIVITALSSQV
jgi:hypothetical protein